MHDCNGCGSCGGCGGCAKELVLTEGEVALLRSLGQYSFLPVARKADDMTPVYLEESDYTVEEYSLILQVLEKKNLISMDYTPLSGADMSRYAGYPVHGSIGLTERGHQVLELLELQGAGED